jgi:hypothetical protein
MTSVQKIRVHGRLMFTLPQLFLSPSFKKKLNDSNNLKWPQWGLRLEPDMAGRGQALGASRAEPSRPNGRQNRWNSALVPNAKLHHNHELAKQTPETSNKTNRHLDG